MLAKIVKIIFRIAINYLLLDLKSLFKELKMPHEAVASFKELSKKQVFYLEHD